MKKIFLIVILLLFLFILLMSAYNNAGNPMKNIYRR